MLITIVSLVALSLAVLGILLWLIKLAKKDIHLTELAPETGKMVKMGTDVVRFLFNSDSGHYEKNGDWVAGRQNLGRLFNLTGRVFFGVSPIYEIFHFSVSWGEYSLVDDHPVVSKKEEKDCTKFKRFYPHAVMIKGAEMAKEGEEGGKDTSTTRIDAVLLVTIEITNIRDAVYKMPPEGIVFSQVNTAVQGGFNDYVKGRKWEVFKTEDKIPQNSEFVQYVIDSANPVLEALGIGMKIKVVELKYHDLTGSEENAELAASQTKLVVAENEGAAEVARARKHKEARKIEGEGEADYLREVAGVIGKDNIAAFANLEKVANTQLRVYGDTKAVPMIDTGGDKS